MSVDLVDTHCHLNLADSFPDPDPYILEAQEAGVSIMMLVALDPETSTRAIELAEAHPGVYAIVGRHPNYAHEAKETDMSTLRQLCVHPKVVAIGEIGLDFHWDFASRSQQMRSLREQLDLAAEVDKPVVLHCREAYPELLDVLEALAWRNPLFHCFSGNESDAVRASALDAYFGVDGPVTYRKADALRDILRKLPIDRLVLETDCPYLTPEPYRGKPNKPAYIPLINAGLAQALGISPDECARRTTANAKRFFRLA